MKAQHRRDHIRATLRDGRRDWYRISNDAASDTAEIYLFDEIGYWGTSAQDFVDELKAITASQITVHINSPGGEIFDGLAIYSCLKAHPADVVVMVDGLAASAASFIAMAGDRIITARNATMMVHDAAGLCIGNATDMRELADLLDKLSGNLADIYAQRAGGTLDGWRQAMRAETWYTGAEAVAAGLADEMTDPDPEPPEEMTARWDLSIFAYAGRENAPAPPLAEPADPAGAGTDAGEPPVAPEPVTPERDDDPDHAAPEPAGEEPPEPEPGDTAEEPVADSDEWATITAHLTDPPDPTWAALTSRLTANDPLEALREALP